MVQRFGSREICDVTFKAVSNNQKVGRKEFKAGQPVFVIDTATASSMEQATTTVYAQGGRGYNRLIAWEGEKTMTFNVTDALLSPMGLALLTGAGLAAEEDVKHIHVTYDVALDAEGKGTIKFLGLADELGIPTTGTIDVCNDTDLVPYATVLDHNGSIVDWADDVVLSGKEHESLANIIVVDADNALEVEVPSAAKKTVKVDFYVRMTDGATEITIEPDDFGGFFYVEADTLYRNQDGKDMAATLTFPKVKIQSGFTLSMAPTGDPSTFDFVMDAFPAYTYFDQTKKVICDITIVSGANATDSGVKHSTPVDHTDANEEVDPTPTPTPTPGEGDGDGEETIGKTLAEVTAAVQAIVNNGDLIGKTEEEALELLNTTAKAENANATVAYGDTPDALSGEGTVIVSLDGEDSDPIDVDIIA